MLEESLAKTNDPKLISARIFVGGINAEKISKEDLARKFELCGKVIGVTVNTKGFAFVQFSNEADATRAITIMHKTMLNGNCIDVRPASQKFGHANDFAAGNVRKRPFDEEQPRLWMERPPSLHYPPEGFGPVRPRPLFGGPASFMDDPHRPANVGPMPSIALGGGGPHVMVGQPPFPGNMMSGDPSRYHPPDAPFREDYMPPGPSSVTQNQPHVQPKVEEPVHVSSAAKKTEYGVEKIFDAVIVVIHKDLKHYAEMVERRLLELNMVVDMIFLLKENALNKAIDDMVCRGILFIIIIQPQHEEHKSLTVHIMTGTPQEHRNMPLEDALIMLSKSFSHYLSGLRAGSEQPTMGFLLNLLADGKNLSVAELDRIIGHLQDRRDRLLDVNGGRKGDVSSSGSSTDMLELQRKILGMVGNVLLNRSASGSLNGTGETAGKASISNIVQQHLTVSGQSTAASMPSSGSGSLLPKIADPGMLKALEGLMVNPSLMTNMQATTSSCLSSTPSALMSLAGRQ